MRSCERNTLFQPVFVGRVVTPTLVLAAAIWTCMPGSARAQDFGPGLLALDETGCGLTLQGDVVLDTQTAPVVSNSKLCVIGAAADTTAERIITQLGLEARGNRNFDNRVESGVPPTRDPLEQLAAPPFDPNECQPLVEIHEGAQLRPGVYCDGIMITGGMVNFEPGQYVLSGAGLVVTGGAVTGDGVTFYLTDSATIGVSGGSRVDLSAPTSGSYQGILFFQDRAGTRAPRFNGGTSSNLNGILYFPSQHLTLGGNASAGSTAIIADTIEITGNSVLCVNCDPDDPCDAE